MSADNKWKQFLLYQRDFPFENPISIAYFPFFKYMDTISYEMVKIMFIQKN